VRLMIRGVRRGVVMAVLLAVVVLSCGGSAWAHALAAQSAPPGSRPTRSGKSVGLGQAECSHWIGTNCYYAFINLTPYNMTLTQADAWYGHYHDKHKWCGSPVQTLHPREKEVFCLKEDEIQWIEARITYVFTDVDGQRHQADYNINSDGNPFVTSNDFNAAGQEFGSVGTFHIVSDPDGFPNDYDAVLSHPAVVTYDANTDPGDAARVMQDWSKGANRDFTVVSGPTYSHSAWTRASAVVENTTKEPATLTMTGTDSHEESTSLSASVTWSTELGFFELANQKVSATLSGGHQWSTTDKQIQSESVTIPGGDVGCLFDSASMATVTGNFTLDLDEITYHINHVTITDPAQAANGPAVDYTPGRATIGKPCAVVQVGGLGGAHHKTPKHHKAKGKSKRAGKHHSRGGKHHRRGSKGSTNSQSQLGRTLVGPAGAPLLTGTPVIIDAAKNPDAAAAAMAHWAESTTTNKDFVVTSNPLYSHTPTYSGNAYSLPKSYPTPEQHGLSVEHDYSSQWSIGGTLSAETKLGIIGFANASLQVSVTAGHEWTTEHDENQAVTATVDPGTINWMEVYTSQVTITGNYSFTANGTDYQIDNVTITEPDNPPPSEPQGPFTGYVFTVISQPLTGQRAQQTTPGYGPAPVSTHR